MYPDHMTGWGWAAMTISWLIAAALLGLLIWVVISALDRRGASSPTPPYSARSLLDERLARGEIDLDEYRALREAIERRT
jgi:putative membrane protein